MAATVSTFIIVLLSGSIFATGSRPFRSLKTQLEGSTTITTQVPQIERQCTEDERKWWNDLRNIGAAIYRLGNEIAAAYADLGKPHRDSSSVSIEPLSSDPLLRLEAQMAVQREKFLAVLKRGADNGYKPPVSDTRLILLFSPRPRYTEEARSLHVAGEVILRVVFQADGNVEGKIVRGLGHGLDEEAALAISQMIYLPSIVDGRFASKTSSLAVTFALR